VRWEDERLRVVAAAGVTYRPDALPDPWFDPGKLLALVPGPQNEHDANAVAIWNAERTLQLGYVPAAVAPELTGDEQAFSLARRRRPARLARASRRLGRSTALNS